MLRVLDLFSGIGGFSLGLERTGGFQTVAFCEIDPFCRKVLAKHWPKVPRYDDVRELTGARLAADGIAVDVICGGFPCQDISVAGKRAGLEGERSGLWGEYRRIIGEVRPRFVIVENVPGLLSLGMGTVLGDLAALGFDAVWDCIPASAVGARHRRDRVWLVAYAGDGGQRQLLQSLGELRRGAASNVRGNGSLRSMAYANDTGLEGWDGRELPERPSEWTARTSSPSPAANAASVGRREAKRLFQSSQGSGPSTGQPAGRDAGVGRLWVVEPDVGRVAHGIPARVDRLRSLGNAVVPQIPEMIGRAILQSEAA